MQRNIEFTKNFVKQYAKLDTKIQRKCDTRIEDFKLNPRSPHLHMHALNGKYSEYYSINITGDMRALFKILDNKIYLFNIIGTHSQLY